MIFYAAEGQNRVTLARPVFVLEMVYFIKKERKTKAPRGPQVNTFPLHTSGFGAVQNDVKHTGTFSDA